LGAEIGFLGDESGFWVRTHEAARASRNFLDSLAESGGQNHRNRGFSMMHPFRSTVNGLG
jgi:hypothetical protein